MSAYVVSKAHIDVLVDAALHGPAGVPVSPGTAWSPVRWFDVAPHLIETGEVEGGWEGHVRRAEHGREDEIGAMLLAENVRSVRHRYADNAPDEMVPDWITEDGYHFERPTRRPTAVEALKALSCFEYQACECPDWALSEAHSFVQALTARCITRLEGYDAAPYTWDEEVARPGRARPAGSDTVPA